MPSNTSPGNTPIRVMDKKGSESSGKRRPTIATQQAPTEVLTDFIVNQYYTVRKIEDVMVNVPRRESCKAFQLTTGLTAEEEKPKISLYSLMATRKLARNLIANFRTRKQRQPNKQDTLIKTIQPTYKLEPCYPFSVEKVMAVITPEVDRYMESFVYRPSMAPVISRALTEVCLSATKRCRFDRYKLVCTVVLGEKLGQQMSIASRCVWDDKTDNHASYTWQNSSIFCCVNIFGIYLD